ncbi:MAG: TIGR01906 family membrane protein [Oscillospiraceae bacterium]|nr:TIGR01906 family membrane protein [Oscillospiraceae bacterium]
MKRNVLGVFKAVLIALVVLAGGIVLPILFRPFFWWHIEPLDLPKITGLSIRQIQTAYGEMMDYCIGLSKNFSAGVLPFSEAGASHFADVRKLFLLDLGVLVISAALLIGLAILGRKQPLRLGGHIPGFWAAVGLGASFVTIAALAAIDFNRAFTVFHKLFFPGKDNWLFDGRTDPIIYMLPAEFFRNCAILILGAILASCLGLLLWDRKYIHHSLQKR